MHQQKEPVAIKTPIDLSIELQSIINQLNSRRAHELLLLLNRARDSRRNERPEMGNDQSFLMGLSSTFEQDEIKRLGKRFKKLDIDNSGSLSVEEFMNLPELKQNPLVKRVIEIFDADQNGEVDFKEFLLGISQFSVKGDKTAKLRFAFRIYDIDNDGYISNGELYQVLKVMVGNNLRPTQLQQIVDKTILYADKDEDGKISFEEFCSVVGNTDIHEKMVIDI